MQRVDGFEQPKQHVIDAATVGEFLRAIDAGQGDGDQAALLGQGVVKRLQVAHAGVHIREAMQIYERFARAGLDDGHLRAGGFNQTGAHFTTSIAGASARCGNLLA